MTAVRLVLSESPLNSFAPPLQDCPWGGEFDVILSVPNQFLLMAPGTGEEFLTMLSSAPQHFFPTLNAFFENYWDMDGEGILLCVGELCMWKANVNISWRVHLLMAGGFPNLRLSQGCQCWWEPADLWSSSPHWQTGNHQKWRQKSCKSWCGRQKWSCWGAELIHLCVCWEGSLVSCG